MKSGKQYIQKDKKDFFFKKFNKEIEISWEGEGEKEGGGEEPNGNYWAKEAIIELNNSIEYFNNRRKNQWTCGQVIGNTQLEEQKEKKKRKGVKKSYGTYEISSTEPIYAYESLRRQEKEKGRKLI